MENYSRMLVVILRRWMDMCDSIRGLDGRAEKMPIASRMLDEE